jgi:dihydrodipicolinate synthase/N-acetylneuraminate lyase
MARRGGQIPPGLIVGQQIGKFAGRIRPLSTPADIWPGSRCETSTGHIANDYYQRLHYTEEATMSLDLDGLIPATVLPMHPDGSIDEPALRTYIGWVAAQGPVALAINVDTGEGPHLSHDEKVRIIKVVRDVTDLPIVAGLAGPSTDAAVRQARDFQAAGADALLVFPIPAYLSTPLNPAVPVAYHTAIAEVGLPLILFQLQPALAGVNYENDVLEGLAMVDGVVAIKEASFDARRFVDTARLLEQLPKKITLLTGNDNFILESFLLGATGALIGFGAVMTKEQVDMIRAWQEGRTDEAVALGRRVQRLADVVFAAPVGDYRVRLKECLRILGLLNAAHVRRPLLPTSDEERAHLADVLREVGLLREPVSAGRVD